MTDPLTFLSACLLLNNRDRRNPLSQSSLTMRDFFKGWKRKAGCVSLAMACLFAAGLIRSLFWIDIVDLHERSWPLYLQTKVRVVSGSQIFSIHGYNETGWKWIRIRNGKEFELSSWFCRWSASEGYNLQVSSQNKNMHPLIVQYWIFVLPLSLLSAYLLLSKPRAKKPTQPIEPDHA